MAGMSDSFYVVGHRQLTFILSEPDQWNAPICHIKYTLNMKVKTLNTL